MLYLSADLAHQNFHFYGLSLNNSMIYKTLIREISWPWRKIHVISRMEVFGAQARDFDADMNSAENGDWFHGAQHDTGSGRILKRKGIHKDRSLSCSVHQPAAASFGCINRLAERTNPFSQTTTTV
jgi:hypothetical protein